MSKTIKRGGNNDIRCTMLVTQRTDWNEYTTTETRTKTSNRNNYYSEKITIPTEH